MMRIVVFLATNLGVMMVASIIFRLLGLDQSLGTNTTGMLIYCALFGMVGSMVSLFCLLYTSPSPRDQRGSRMPSSA